MAGPNYGLIDNALVNKNRAMEGYGAANTLYSQNLENQAAQIGIQNAMAEQAAGQAAGGDVAQYQKNLMALGQGKQSVAIGKAVAETEQARMKALVERLPMQREMSKDMAFNPSNENIQAHLQDQILKGWITPDQAKISWGNVANMNPEQRREFFLNNATKAEDVLKEMETRRHNRVTEGISGGHLALAQKREDRIASGITAATLTPQQNEALFGENGAATRGLINPNKLNARTAKMWADAFILNPNANPTAVSQDIKAAEKSINSFAAGEDGKTVQRLNTASDHLETLQEMIPTLKNNDVRAFNAMANRLAAETGQPAPTNFQQAARIVGSEVAKAIIPGQGASKEREEFVKPFSTAASPAQLQGAIDTSLKLLGGQYKSLENKYRTATKRTDFADTQLTPGAKNAYQSATGGAKPAAPAAARPAGVGADWQLMTDASGNKAWVSPDKKSFKEVK